MITILRSVSKAEQLHVAAETFLHELKTSLQRSEELNKKVCMYVCMYERQTVYMYVYSMYIHFECSMLAMYTNV